jgi:hypothetical protein
MCSQTNAQVALAAAAQAVQAASSGSRLSSSDVKLLVPRLADTYLEWLDKNTAKVSVNKS